MNELISQMDFGGEQEIAISLFKKSGNELFYLHSPKMNFIQYFSSIGGLIAIWFGFSLYHIFLKILSKILKYSFVEKLIISLFIGFTLRIDKIIKTFIILIFTALMFYQLIEVIESYEKSETIVVTELFRQMNLPKVTISNKILKRKIYKLIKGSKFKQFSDAIKHEELIKSCYIMIRGKSFDCGQKTFRISLGEDRDIYPMTSLLVNFNDSYKEFLLGEGIQNDIEKVSIELKRFEYSYIFLEYLKNPIIDKNFDDTNIYFYSYCTESLSTSKIKCKRIDDKKLIFSNNREHDCNNDCKLFMFNQTFGCILSALLRNQMELDINKHLLSTGYKICAQNVLINETIVNRIDFECFGKCLKVCNRLVFKLKLKSNQISLRNKTTKRINLFPLNTIGFKYIEKLKIDLNQLIYECGGIIGLWFGFTSMKISELILFSVHYSVALLKLLYHRIKILLISCYSFFESR
jgi:hypothetical protein